MNFDQYFHSICETISIKSPCLSRKIGAILVRDNSIVATGYNGPPRGIPHCGYDRILKDKVLSDKLNPYMKRMTTKHINGTCPRQLIPSYKSGERMELCPAQHAEVNCISNAARLGVSTVNTTLYMNCIIPCKNCFGAILNAGIGEIVIDEISFYDKYTWFLNENSKIKIREFRL